MPRSNKTRPTSMDEEVLVVRVEDGIVRGVYGRTCMDDVTVIDFDPGALDDDGPWVNCIDVLPLCAAPDDLKDALNTLDLAMPESPWDSDNIQFARLLSEIDAVGGFEDDGDVNRSSLMDELCDSMNLEEQDVREILSRAWHRWTQIRQATVGEELDGSVVNGEMNNE